MAEQCEADLSFVVDGLDESAEPWRVASDLLVPLAASPGVWVLVGTRPSLESRLDSDQSEEGTLLRALGGHEPVWVQRNADAMGTYLAYRLRRKVEELSRDLVTDLARKVADVPDQPFLYARLVAFEVEAAPDPVRFAKAIVDNGPQATVGVTCTSVFANALTRIQKADPANTALLQALALAQGRGIPKKDGIWTIVAKGLAPSEIEVTEAKTQALFDSRARAYITGDWDLEQSVYRFAHRTFQEAVLDDMLRPFEEPLKALAGAHAKISAALTNAAWQTLTTKTRHEDGSLR
jgi:hypothetical protein